MKGGFFAKARPDPEAGKIDSNGKRIWSDEMVDDVVESFLQILGEKDSLGWNDMERRLRTGTGVREYSDMTSLHGHGHGHGGYGQNPQDFEMDVASRLIMEKSSPSSLRDRLPQIMEQAASIFGRVKEKGKAEGQHMDTVTEQEVIKDILRECLIRDILKAINNANSGSHAAGSSDGGLLATPGGYYAGDLNELTGDCIRGLMEKGYGYQDEFMGGNTVDNLFRELELLEFDGKFADVQQQKLIGIRTDKICWFTPDDVDREKQPALSAVFKKLISIPFELNKKCNLCLQGSASFQLACYPKKGYYNRHVDGGYDALNNGRKVTAVYYGNPSWSESDGGHLRVFQRQLNPYQIEKMQKDGQEVPPQNYKEAEMEEDVTPLGDRLVLFRSRDVPHEVRPCGRKRFAISMWVMGPPGPGDQPDGYYTPT
jgi:Rps23 Pro-64 3,4-dihydroxylase Tpa1-like proline 4-hydroxylase